MKKTLLILKLKISLQEGGISNKFRLEQLTDQSLGKNHFPVNILSRVLFQKCLEQLDKVKLKEKKPVMPKQKQKPKQATCFLQKIF